MKLEGRDGGVCHSKNVPSVVDIGSWHIGMLQEDGMYDRSSLLWRNSR